MDIASLSTALSSVQTASGTSGATSDVGVLMLSKQLDLTETMGAEMVKAMEQSVNPNLGANFDVSI
ncbi:MAG: YjfB family protein [Lachnospiraceae bacterium]|nr:YjfB family protein [Lachnospiraceae bacterium]